jgi:dsRNA-specific ribonuclease
MSKDCKVCSPQKCNKCGALIDGVLCKNCYVKCDYCGLDKPETDQICKLCFNNSKQFQYEEQIETQLSKTLENVFLIAKLKRKYIDILLSHTKEYQETAFTSVSVDPKINQEVYEFAGDPIATAILNAYFIRRFPQLNCTEGVKVFARLKINFGSRKSFSQIADALGFWPHIRATETQKEIDKEKLLEDTFEAFIGLTSFILDDIMIGCGYAICYEIIKSIFDNMTISLEYDDLYDEKSKLNELINANPELGKMKFIDEERNAKVFVKSANQNRLLAESGPARTKGERHQIAAGKALEILHSEGYTLRRNFEIFCD